MKTVKSIIIFAIMAFIVVLTLPFIGKKDELKKVHHPKSPYTYIQLFKEYGVYKVENYHSRKEGYCDLNWKPVVPFKVWLNLFDPSDGCISYIEEHGCGYYTIGDWERYALKSVNTVSFYAGGKAIAGRNGKFGLIDKKGGEIVPIIYPFYDKLDLLSECSLDDGVTFYDKNRKGHRYNLSYSPVDNAWYEVDAHGYGYGHPIHPKY